MQMALVNVNL